MIFKKKAVAIKYSDEAELPFITASAKGILAERLLKIAEEEHVPIVHNDNLANVLSLQEVGACIPEETWTVVAKIFAFMIKIGERND